MDSFASELGVTFHTQFEADHVIPKSSVLFSSLYNFFFLSSISLLNGIQKHFQIWVGAIPNGAKGTNLQGVYKNAKSNTYLDDIGESIIRTIEVVPFGVLCFMSSYTSLETMIERWKLTNAWSRMESIKTIFVGSLSFFFSFFSFFLFLFFFFSFFLFFFFSVNTFQYISISFYFQRTQRI